MSVNLTFIYSLDYCHVSKKVLRTNQLFEEIFKLGLQKCVWLCMFLSILKTLPYFFANPKDIGDNKATAISIQYRYSFRCV